MIRRVAIILLLICSMAHGANKWYDWAGAGNWSDPTKWEPGGVGGGDGTYPGEADTDDQPQFYNASGNCTLDVNPQFVLASVLCNAGTGYDGTFAFGANHIHVANSVIFGSTTGAITAEAGAKIYCGGNFAKLWTIADGGVNYPENLTIELDGTGTLSSYSGVTGGQLIVNTVGVIDANSQQYWDSFTLTAGTYDDNMYNHFIVGSIVLTGGDLLTSTSTWTMIAEGNLQADHADRTINSLVIGNGATFTATMTGNTYFNAASINAATTLTGNFYFWAYEPDANNFLDMAGTVEGGADVQVLLDGNRSNNGFIKADVLQISGHNSTLTVSGVIAATTTLLRGTAVAVYAKLAVGVADCSLGAITLGWGATDTEGRLDLGNGAYAVAIASAAVSGTGANELDFGNAVISLSNTIDGTGITSTAGTTPIISGSGGSAVITNVDLSGSEYLDARGIFGDSIADGGGNDNVRFARGLIGGGVF